MTHHHADHIYRAYLAELDHRRSGYPRASAGFASARHVTRCCRAPTIQNRRGNLVCAVCTKTVVSKTVCDLVHLEMRGPHGQRADTVRSRVRHERRSGEVLEYTVAQRVRVEPVAVHETRQVDRGGEDRKNVHAMDRTPLLARLIEPRPRDMTRAQWRYTLKAWELVLDHGVTGAAEAGSASIFTRGLGPWSRWHVTRARDDGRRIVNARAERRGREVDEVLGLLPGMAFERLMEAIGG